MEVEFGSKSALSSYHFSESASAVGEAERVGTSELPTLELHFRSGAWGWKEARGGRQPPNARPEDARPSDSRAKKGHESRYTKGR